MSSRGFNACHIFTLVYISRIELIDSDWYESRRRYIRAATIGLNQWRITLISFSARDRYIPTIVIIKFLRADHANYGTRGIRFDNVRDRATINIFHGAMRLKEKQKISKWVYDLIKMYTSYAWFMKLQLRYRNDEFEVKRSASARTMTRMMMRKIVTAIWMSKPAVTSNVYVCKCRVKMYADFILDENESTRGASYARVLFTFNGFISAFLLFDTSDTETSDCILLQPTISLRKWSVHIKFPIKTLARERER